MANSPYSNTSNIHPSFVITSPSPTPMPTPTPNTVFQIKIYFCHCFEFPPPWNTMTHHHLELNQTFRLTHKQLLLDPEGRRIISEKLSTMGLEPEVIESGISQFLSIAREKTRNNDCEILTIRILVHLYPIIDSEILEESIQDVPRPIPASKEAIQKLEKVSFQACSDSMRECTICYEKFHQNDHLDQIVRLPCGHVYHKDCILKWLEISHMCPLCRYQLPCYEN